MNSSIQLIKFANLALALIPVLVVVGIFYKWALNFRNVLYAVFRMVVQLLLIGYFLIYIFESNSPWIVILILAVMVFASSWISLTSIKAKRKVFYKRALFSITVGGGTTLFLITQGVLDLHPWYWPRYMIPLAGMIFANAMNSVSLAAERLEAELARNVHYEKARSIALRASLIPITNSLFAVGLVSLPGMMTGQIIAGQIPVEAVKYQIMVMFMLAGGTSMGAILMALLVFRRLFNTRHQLRARLIRRHAR